MNDALSRSVDTRYATRRQGTTGDGPTLHGKRPWGFGNYVPGPCWPHGSIHPSPDTASARTGGYDPGEPIRGFSQLHVSGTGGPGKYGTILLAPMSEPCFGETAHDSPFSDEVAEAAYYAATLQRWGIRVEVTATHHAAIYRITFPSSRPAHLLIDIAHSIPADVMRRGGGPLSGDLAWHDDGRSLSGRCRHAGGWGTHEYAAAFHLAISAPGEIGMVVDGVPQAGSRYRQCERAGQRLGATWRGAGGVVLVKVGVSLRDPGRAASLLAAEIPDWDFDAVRARATAAWAEAIDAVRVDGVDAPRRRILATCLRNSLIMPRDRSADCPHDDTPGPWWDDQYCVWDTFRTVFPLLTLMRPQAVAANIAGFARRLRLGEQVTDAYINGRELALQPAAPGTTPWFGGMGGEMVDVVIADAFVKGLAGVDWPSAFAVLRAHADHGRCRPYREDDRGWIPDDDRLHSDGSCVRHPAAFSLEMSYTDDCAARMARGLGEDALAQRLRRRAQQWPALWNPALTIDGFSGFFSGRRRDGSFNDHDAADVRHGAFTESTTWDYDHFVPHDMAQLIALHGGSEAYAARVESAIANDRLLLDNEPSFLFLHSLLYAGRPDLCQRWTRAHLLGNYTVDAVPGPDDSGAMASWYVFGALGFLPVAGQDLYLIHGPLQPWASVRLGTGVLTIIAEGWTEDRPYIASATLDGRPLERAWLRHRDIAHGGELVFRMSDRPTTWGAHALPPGPWESTP